MDTKLTSPMYMVEDVEMELRRLASLCNVMMFVDSSTCEVDANTVSNVMTHLWDCLETQIKALHRIEWNTAAG